jgi:hypothetical protein
MNYHRFVRLLLLLCLTHPTFALAQDSGAPEPAPTNQSSAIAPQTPAQSEATRTDSLAPEPAAAIGGAEPASSVLSAPPRSADTAQPPAPVEVAAPDAKRPATMEEVAQNSTQELHFGRLKARYVLNFFGEVLVAAHVPGGGDQAPAFAIGAQDIVLRGELGEHLAATTEFAIEFGDDNKPGIDLERLTARWQDAHFYIDAGRSHSDIGYWNTAYHHGHWLQPSIARPSWVRFEDEGGLLPAHWVGLTGAANAQVGTGTLQLTLAIGNGRGKVQDDIRNNFDYAASKATYAKLEYVGIGALRDLRIGVSGVYDLIAQQDASVRPALPDHSIDEWIGGFHVAYPSFPVTLIIEGYLITHRVAQQAWQTYGGFALAGYAIGHFMPYAEISHIKTHGGADPFFSPNGDMSVDEFDVIGGLRFDVSTWSALKLEYAYVHRPMASARHAVTLDWSWGF